MAKENVQKKRRKVVVSKKAKKWFTITAPKMFDNKEIGHTRGIDDTKITGRKFTLPMNQLTGSFSDYDSSVTLKIINVMDGCAHSEYAGQALMEDKISRLVNKWSSRIDTITDISSTDNRTVRVKLVTITAERVKVNVKKEIRSNVEGTVVELLKKMSFDSVVKEILDKKFSRTIKTRASKVYPIRSVDIRMVEVL
ncbi:MAG: hypothetical protein KAJ54_01755 [Candidatus Aenigmarchaeota archaeon]|nr:hypothetical protein [Candidatus Aenigmarchaeota archaeon]MCK5322018.1 hypothetical protein [Candidatus Aenigmarchaeota archaeon]